jgi:hypothetical protein
MCAIGNLFIQNTGTPPSRTPAVIKADPEANFEYIVCLHLFYHKICFAKYMQVPKLGKSIREIINKVLLHKHPDFPSKLEWRHDRLLPNRMCILYKVII